jgi:hypothetical protein
MPQDMGSDQNNELVPEGIKMSARTYFWGKMAASD